MKKIKYIIFTIIILNLFCTQGLNSQLATANTIQNGNKEKVSNFDELSQNTATFYQLSVNNTNPTPTQAVNISSVIYDPVGIKNSTLFWIYNSINSTEYNSSMSLSSSLTTSSPSKSGYLYPNGTETNTTQSLRFAEFTYELSNSYITGLTESVSVSGGNNLVYLKIESKDYQTSIWTTIFEKGNISVTGGFSAPIAFTDNNVTSGYRIFAVSYKSKSPSLPSLSTTISKGLYSAIIPASNQPSLITYYLKVFNTLNNVSVTQSYNLVMNTPLTISVTSVPTEVSTNSFKTNISITDPDGWNWIDQSSVKAYYMIPGKTNSYSTSLTLISNVSLTTAIFSGTINITALRSNVNNTMVIYYQAKDLIPGFSPSVIKTNNQNVVLVGDPSLAPLPTLTTSINSQQTSSGTGTYSDTSNTSGTSSSKGGKNSPWNDIFILLGFVSLSIVGIKRKQRSK